MERYIRQIQLQGFGEVAQQKLLSAKVLLVGAGGLGCPILLQLAATGVGNIGIVDNDVVSLDNLHRQTLYDTTTIGQKKVEVAAKRLRTLNPDVNYYVYPEKLTHQNAKTILQSYDVIIDGTDHIPTRYLLNDMCVKWHKPLVYGAIYQYEGQVAVFNLPDEKGISTDYRDIFPIPPAENQVPTCHENGVLGVLPQLIGTFMATEAIKIITNFGMPLINQLLYYNIKTHQQQIIKIAPNPNKNQPIHSRPTNVPTCIMAISATETASRILDKDNAHTLVDVRNEGETPVLPREIACIALPLTKLSSYENLLQPLERIIFVCQSGKRSQHAALIMSERYPDKTIYYLRESIHLFLNIYENSISQHQDTTH